MIQPAYLAQLRRELRAEQAMTLVQIEQLVPGWWPTQRQAGWSDWLPTDGQTSRWQDQRAG